MKEFIKKIISSRILLFYHRILSSLAAICYGFPSKKLIVIGVTGTKGKSTVVNLIAAILEQAGFKTGFTSTANFKIAKELPNDLVMTMPGRFTLQKMLGQMVKAGCRYAVIETSSEGILQHRHADIEYDVAVFTNLSPEHLLRHGSFENYKRAKLELFRHTSALPRKILNGRRVPKAIIANGDDPHAADFLQFPADKKIVFSRGNLIINSSQTGQTLVIQTKQTDLDGSRFSIGNKEFATKLLGDFNIENCAAAIAVAASQNIDFETSAAALANFGVVPGRMEFVSAGQNFKVLVDYAHEPKSMKMLYETIASWPKNKIIHVFGSMGGGRDKARRPILGEMAGKTADFVIITDESSYDENPNQIIEEIMSGALRAGKVAGKDLFCFADRHQAIKKALALAGPDDLVLITGKGAEQAIMSRGGRKIPWDDRKVALEELEALKNKTVKD